MDTLPAMALCVVGTGALNDTKGSCVGHGWGSLSSLTSLANNLPLLSNWLFLREWGLVSVYSKTINLHLNEVLLVNKVSSISNDTRTKCLQLWPQFWSYLLGVTVISEFSHVPAFWPIKSPGALLLGSFPVILTFVETLGGTVPPVSGFFWLIHHKSFHLKT